MNLLEAILKAQNGGAVNQLAQQFGLQQNQAQDALKNLLPAVSTGLKRNVQREGGTEALLEALGRGNHARYLDDPRELARPETRDDGNAILGKLLGSKDVSRAVADRAAQNTGMDAGLLKKMLPYIASLAMGSLAKNSASSSSPIGGLLQGMMGGGGGSGGAGALAGMLGGLLGGGGQAAPQQRQQPQGGGGLGGMLGNMLGGGQQSSSSGGGGALEMFGNLLDADGDGSAMDDIFDMVMKRR